MTNSFKKIQVFTSLIVFILFYELDNGKRGYK